MKINETRRRLLALLLVTLLLTTAALSAGAAVSAEADAEPEAAVRQVEAATVDELLSAIAPDTCVTLTGRSYDLTRATGYGVYGSQWYGWNGLYDEGWELAIMNVANLTIRATLPGTEIITQPIYAAVLKFDGCRNVTLEGFTAGHSEGAGYCTGAVLSMDGCRDMLVSACDLYGCGTYGLELNRCRGVHAVDTTIRDCSYGAVTATSCEDVLLDGCSVHGIRGFGGLFELRGCQDCALINSVVRSCAGDSLLTLNGTKGFMLAGCEVSRNEFAGMFSCSAYAPEVWGCAFRDNSGSWYYDEWQRSERAVDSQGVAYTDEELAGMTLVSGVHWSAPEREEKPVEAPPVSEDGMVHVHTVDELLAAIAPDTAIFLEDGVYDLSQAASYGFGGGDYWYWISCYDGPGLAVAGADNLTITGAGPHRARIVAEPRYAEVLSFENCRGLSLSGFTAGHTQSLAGMSCAGGVLSLSNCRNFKVEDCSLYGCGILGVTCFNCADGEVRFTEIYDCNSGALYCYDTQDLALTGCNVHDIPSAPYSIYDCRNITVDGVTLPEGESW